jgi:uncharacterized protein (DUF934 family)
MAVFKGEGFVADGWRYLAAGEGVPPSGMVIVNLSQWQEFCAAARDADIPLGLYIEPGQDIKTILPHLRWFSLVVIGFAKFTDGRGYSLARQFRSHHGFNGELRASGDILFDQLQLLSRCGFDSFEITNAATIRLLEAGRRPLFEIFYQPGLGPEIPEETRPWARRA